MPELKPLVALYKAYRGGEWFEASLESVRRHCAGIVAVMSDRPWNRTGYAGDFPPENCSAPLERFRRRRPGCPVTALRPGYPLDTEQQYKIGLHVIKAAYGDGCNVLIVDTDEVWEDRDLRLLREVMHDDRKSLYFRSAIHTYVRSPLYRVAPREAARPVVGLASPNVPTGRSRFADLHSLVGGRDRVRDVDCTMHHFGYVRLDPEEIGGKLANSSAQDGSKARQNWKSVVWNDFPEGKDIHPSLGAERCWGGLEVITPGQLPDAVLESDTYWLTLAHHKGGVPADSLLHDDEKWREFAERDLAGISTTAPPGMEMCLSAALTQASDGRTTQDDAIFLAPRLRMSFRETLQLAQLARHIPSAGVAMEIGSGMGGSMAVIGCCAKHDVELFAVDPFIPYDEENATISRNLEVGKPEDFHYTMERLRLNPILLRYSSQEARQFWEDGTNAGLDLLLVDGNHSYANAKQDMEMWWPLVKPGGVMLLHDLSGRFPGVVRAAREFEQRTGCKFNLPRMSSLAYVWKF